MKKLTLLSIVFALGLGAAFIVGCNSSSPEEVLGDPNDPSFQFVENIVADEALNNVGKIIDISFLFFDSIPGVSSSSTKLGEIRQSQDDDETYVVDSFNYAYANGWHSFAFWLYVVDTVTHDTVDVSGIDSLRARNNGVPMQIPDSTVDELNIRAHYDIDLRTGTLAGSADYSLDMTNISSDLVTNPVTINASGSEVLTGIAADSQVTCDFSLSNSLAASNIVAQLEGATGCPTSGVLNLTATVDISCTGQIGSSQGSLDVNGEWMIGAVFNNDEVTISYTDGTTVWQATEPCDEPVASPVSKWVPRLD